jgi:spoIIIJ-associated protein
MTTQTFEASSVDEALEAAAKALDTDVASLQYEVEEKAADFWGMGDTVFVVTVTVADEAAAASEPAAAAPDAPPEPSVDATETPAGDEVAAPSAAEVPAAAEAASDDVPAFFAATADAPAAPEPTPEPAPDPVAATATPDPAPAPTEAPSGDNEAADASAAVAEGDDLTAQATTILENIFGAMGFECTADAKLDGGTMHVAITGEDNQYLLEGRGRGLAALELILNHSFRAFPDRAHKRVRVDAGDFRSQRDDEIRDIAFQVAHRAKETNSEQQTSELNPYERRIVHLTLADDTQVTTRSLGNGFLKAVNVIPTGGARRG